MQGQADPRFQNGLTRAVGIDWPIIQAPMAGVSGPALAAAVSNAGGLGSLGLGAMAADAAAETIAATRAATDRPFHVNLFCHRPARADPAREAAWLARMGPLFAGFGARPPERLAEIYRSYAEDRAMQAMLLDLRPPVVSFHFGLPPADHLAALRRAGVFVMASATNLAEARAGVAAGAQAIIAQGWEAGGHRGLFDPAAPDPRLGMLALVQMLAAALPVPVVAAGGIMTGGAVAGALAAGASAAQLGTAFIACPESLADDSYRAALTGAGGQRTVMTAAISGRPARCLGNRFTDWAADLAAAEIPDYPRAYDAGKALNAAARAAGETGFGAQWAGQGAPLARALPAAALMAALVQEMRQAGAAP